MIDPTLYFPNFFLVRNLFYLAGIFLGTGLGFFLVGAKKKKYISVALCMLSVCVVLFSPVIILSNMQFVFHINLLIVFFCITAICAVAVYFPVFVLFPLITASSLVIIFLCFFIFRFPFYNEYSKDTEKNYVEIAKLDIQNEIQIDLSAGLKNKKYKKSYPFNASKSNEKNEDRTFLNYTVFLVQIENLFPVTGGRIYVIPLSMNLIEEGGFTKKILQESQAQNFIFNKIFNHANKLFFTKKITDSVELGAIYGSDYRLYFDGKNTVLNHAPYL
ncbi:MAG: hypothetical protein Ta2F_04010 [Termitinemataceae bacterium]|nr:MAG: hypothetical protein Ta2F_04010 [Termitinemataceae bacterium]